MLIYPLNVEHLPTNYCRFKHSNPDNKNIFFSFNVQIQNSEGMAVNLISFESQYSAKYITSCIYTPIPSTVIRPKETKKWSMGWQDFSFISQYFVRSNSPLTPQNRIPYPRHTRMIIASKDRPALQSLQRLKITIIT